MGIYRDVATKKNGQRLHFVNKREASSDLEVFGIEIIPKQIEVSKDSLVEMEEWKESWCASHVNPSDCVVPADSVVAPDDGFVRIYAAKKIVLNHEKDPAIRAYVPRIKNHPILVGGNIIQKSARYVPYTY